jgi:hypothetical protein
MVGQGLAIFVFVLQFIVIAVVSMMMTAITIPAGDITGWMWMAWIGISTLAFLFYAIHMALRSSEFAGILNIIFWIVAALYQLVVAIYPNSIALAACGSYVECNAQYTNFIVVYIFFWVAFIVGILAVVVAIAMFMDRGIWRIYGSQGRSVPTTDESIGGYGCSSTTTTTSYNPRFQRLGIGQKLN